MTGVLIVNIDYQLDSGFTGGGGVLPLILRLSLPKEEKRFTKPVTHFLSYHGNKNRDFFQTDKKK